MTNDKQASTILNRDLALFPDASSMASQFRAKDVIITSFDQGRRAARGELGLDPSYEKAGPAARIRWLELSRDSPDTICPFLNTGAQINTIRQVQGALRCVVSGAQ